MTHHSKKTSFRLFALSCGVFVSGMGDHGFAKPPGLSNRSAVQSVATESVETSINAAPATQVQAAVEPTSETFTSAFEDRNSLGVAVQESGSKIHPALVRRLEKTPKGETVKAWVLFRDKGIALRSDYKSATDALAKTYNRRSIERRIKRRTRPGLFDEYDLPVVPAYIAQVEAVGARVHVASKWVNGVSVHATKAQLEQIAQLPFVKALQSVRRAKRIDPVKEQDPTAAQRTGAVSRGVAGGGDTCGTATVIPGIPYSDTGSTTGFADDYAENCVFDPTGSEDVVYSYTPGSDVTVDIQLCDETDFYMNLYVYEDACPGGGIFACGEQCFGPGYFWGGAIFNLSLTGGHTYYIVIDGANGWDGNYSIDITAPTVYGRSNNQLDEINLIALHDLGFTGNDVVIGMLDSGFWTTHDAFNFASHPLDIVAAWDFVDGDADVSAGSHGTNTLGTIGAYLPDVLIGGAYDASFILCRTEDGAAEYLGEEDNYVAGLEFIESNGGDMATASLSYLDFDDPLDSYTQADLDGLTAISTLGVNVATSNGMHCVNSAGNAGHDADPITSNLGAPADAFDVITVGATYGTGAITDFSSDGPTADGRVKPEVLARGFNVSTVDAGDDTGYVFVAGTSFSGPITAAAVACLIDAHPTWSVAQMREALSQTADYFVANGTYDPLYVLGYGIIDVLAATTFVTGGDSCSDATPLPLAVGPLGSPNTITFTGDTSSATGPECDGSVTSWWEAFETDKCANITIDFCGTSPRQSSNYTSLLTYCEPDGSACGNYWGRSGFNRDDCGDGNITIFYSVLPGQTYYYPIIAYEPWLENPPGPYVMHVSAEECTGACCDFDTSTCTESVTEDACTGQTDTWHPGLSCAQSGCIGACCDPSATTCAEDVFSTLCQGAGEEFVAGTECCQVECRDRTNVEKICVGGPDAGAPCVVNADCTPPGICEPAPGSEYDSSGVTLLSNVTIEEFDAFFAPVDGNPWEANEVWHYASGSQVYAIIGFSTGTGFVRVTDPTNPVIVGYIDGGGVDWVWRDMAVYGQYAYIVNDSFPSGDGPGLQIVDMGSIDSDVVTLVNTTNLGGAFFTAHNVFVNEDSGYLYLVLGDDGFNTGLTAVDLNVDPVNPTVAGMWTEQRVHDVYVTSYTSGTYAGMEVAFAFCEGAGMYIVDVTDKGAMGTPAATLSSYTYSNMAYTHQGWLSDDKRHVFFGDELDEYWGFVSETLTHVVDVQDLASPTAATTFTNGTCAVDHNLMVGGPYVFEANYSTGMRIFNVCDVNDIQEIGYFDTRPEDNITDFVGAWGVDTQLSFASASRAAKDIPVLVSDMQRGLFVLDVRGALFSADTDGNGMPDNCESAVPNPPALPGAPHDAPKNRYITIDPATNASESVAIQVSLSSMMRCSGDDRRACVTDADCPGICSHDPDLQCVSDAICGGGNICVFTDPCVEQGDVGNVAKYVDTPYVNSCVPLGDCATQWFAQLTNSPVYRVWTENTVHILGCRIVPVADYEIRATSDGVSFSDPLIIGTIPKPQVHYGDCVGPVMGGSFTPADGFTNVTDVQAFLAAQGGAANAPHTTWVDLQSGSLPVVPQQILNVGDLQTIKAGFTGSTYVNTPGHENPGDCP